MFPAADPPPSTIFAFNPEYYQPLLEFAQTAGIRTVQKLMISTCRYFLSTLLMAHNQTLSGCFESYGLIRPMG